MLEAGLIVATTSFRKLNFGSDAFYRSGRSEMPKRFGRRPRSCILQPRAAQFRDSQKVVSCSRDEGRHLGFGLSNETRFAQSADGFQPTEDFFNAFSLSLADSIPFGAGRATIKSRRFAISNSRDMRTNLMLAQVRDEILDVVTLVCRQRLGMNATATGAREQGSCSTVFGLRRFGDQNVDAQPVAVLHEHMPAVAELRRLAVALSHEARVRIGRALMRRVRALLALEIDHPGAVAAVLRWLAVLALEALERGPSIDQRAVDGEMVRG